MDWNDTNHLLQALLMVAGVFMLWQGFNAGNRLD